MDFIEEFDTAIRLWTDGDLFKALSERPNDEVYEFAETLALISRYHFRSDGQPNENFSFIANSSLSGGRHPCSSPDCRIEKLKQLTSFAALYADEVHIQDPFENTMIRGVEAVNEVQRLEIISGILHFYFLKPLFEKGIIKFAQNMVHLCQHHTESLADPLSAEIERKEKVLYQLFHEYLIDRCSIIFDVGKGAGPFFEISGPSDLIDHGERYIHLFDPLPDFVKFIQQKRLPYKLTKNEIIDEEILSLIISPILRDLSNQEWHSAFYATSYLCDSPIQMQLASKLNNDAYVANSNAFEKGMNHYLPAIYGQDMNAILRLREQEGEAFSVYRDKLTAMIHQSKSWDEKEVKEVFRDQVLPEINLIEKKIKDWKSRTRESLKEKAIFGSGAVTVGLYAGILPPDIGQIVAALGGGSAVAGALLDYNKTLKEKQEARANDFYFLWRVKQ